MRVAARSRSCVGFTAAFVAKAGAASAQPLPALGASSGTLVLANTLVVAFLCHYNAVQRVRRVVLGMAPSASVPTQVLPRAAGPDARALRAGRRLRRRGGSQAGRAPSWLSAALCLSRRVGVRRVAVRKEREHVRARRA